MTKFRLAADHNNWKIQEWSDKQDRYVSKYYYPSILQAVKAMLELEVRQDFADGELIDSLFKKIEKAEKRIIARIVEEGVK